MTLALPIKKNKENVVVINHPMEFRDGVRIMMLTLRSKDGGNNNPDHVAIRKVTRNRDEWWETMQEFLAKRKGQERIYASVDERDMKKAVKTFKQRQLDADYYDEISHDDFYIDVYNRWIGSLAQSPKGTLFQVDIDDGEDNEEAILAECKEKNIEIVHQYKTKNGRHLILQPFNPALVTFEVKKNAMLLVAYNDYKNTQLKK